MINPSRVGDKTAIALSVLCLLHCLALPFLLLLLPNVAVQLKDSEWFHFWIVMIVLPVSLYSLAVGCKQHKHMRVLLLGVTGLIFLLAAIFVEGNALIVAASLSEALEKALTLAGSVVIVFAHVINYRLCGRARENLAARPGAQQLSY